LETVQGWRNVRNTQKVAGVILNGRYYSKAELQKILARVEEDAKKEAPVQKSGNLF
jgi:hypothetical protein